MGNSIFNDKSKVPTDEELSITLGNTLDYWITLKNFVYEKYPAAIEEWNFPGVKYGWSFRMKDKKRAIIYLLPKEKYFLTAFVFGQKATDILLGMMISNEIKTELENARVYAEGRGIRIDVKSEMNLNDIKKLIEVKIAN